MSLFNKQKKLSTQEQTDLAATPASKPISLERPRICAMDLPRQSLERLASQGYNVFEGTLGTTVKVPNKRKGDNHLMLLNHNIPENFHEYDILIVDLTTEITEEYTEEHRSIPPTKRKELVQLVCGYPATLFDPKPYVSTLLADSISSIRGRLFIQIIFAGPAYHLEYRKVTIDNVYDNMLPEEVHSIYDFWPGMPTGPARSGQKVTVCPVSTDLFAFLDRYKLDVRYEQTFFHPSAYNQANRAYEPDPQFTPLLENINEEIVSFAYVQNDIVFFVFPDIDRKAEFLCEFLKQIAPAIVPALFPYSTEFKWIEDPAYFLPNHEALEQEKEQARQAFSAAIEKIERRQAENTNKLGFLHELLTETGSKLVQAVYRFLKWLEFGQVTIMEDIAGPVLEEDIQIEHENGLLIVEIKGIGGTSTDSDCSQIAKIRSRRWKQRNKFDVRALYIVNHQRYQPPLNRRNPPFSEHQATDAISDDRGLLSTWQLFQLHEDIQHGLLTKMEAREALFKPGIVSFRPKIIEHLGRPKHLYREGYVAILDITNTPLRTGQTLLAEKDNRFHKATILVIKLDDKEVETVENGKVGLQLDIKVGLTTLLYTI